jgi:VWFA-related protein
MRRLALAFVVVAVVSVAAVGQQPAAPPTPTLRASVDQVVVDVVVTDASGMVSSGLTAADFTILEDGRPQRLETFTEVALPFAVRQPGSPLSPAADVRTNRQVPDGRVYVVLLDDYFVMAARTAGVRQLAATFLDQYVQPGDLVAVATTSGVAGGTQAFTDDMRLVRRAVDRFVGKKTRSATVEKLEAYYRAREMDPSRSRRADPRTPTFNRDGAVLGVNAIDDELLDRGTGALRTVKGVVQSLAAVSGRRRALLYLSEGIDIPIAAGNNAEVARELDGVLSAAARANVTVYAIDPRGLHGSGDEIMDIRAMPTAASGEMPTSTMAGLERERRVSRDMLRSIADGTGGHALVESSRPESALERIVAESSHYYLLGYTPPSARRDGRYHALEVRVNRPGLSARARKGYTAPDEKAPRPEPIGGLSPDLSALLRQPLPSAGLPLAAQAVAFPAATDNVSVTIEVGAGALTFAPRGDARYNALDVAILPVDAAGRTHGLTQGHPQLTVAPDMADVVFARGLRLSHRLTLPPGEYQLRIAVREQTGSTAGSVLCDLVVPDPVAPGLAMTSIVTSASSAIAVPSAYNDPGLLWALGGPPTTARAFWPGETLSAYVELIDVGATATRDVDLSTVVRDARGRDVVRSQQPQANGRVPPAKSFAYAVDLPLKTLAPGRYVLRIEARASGLGEPLARELTFDVRSPDP